MTTYSLCIAEEEAIRFLYYLNLGRIRIYGWWTTKQTLRMYMRMRMRMYTYVCMCFREQNNINIDSCPMYMFV